MSLHAVPPPQSPPLPPRMARDWILPVIADLARFAAMNRLPGLAADLERCLDTAREEIATPPP